MRRLLGLGRLCWRSCAFVKSIERGGQRPKKLHVVVARVLKPEDLPSIRTIARIQERAGEIKQRRRRPEWSRPTEAPDYDAKAPGDLWTVDFKGWWNTADGARCEPLTVRDAFSRSGLCAQLMI